MEAFDLIVIGGGPGGYTAAERASRNGLKTALIERRALGGVCLNEGCIPTKTLLYSAKIFHLLEEAKKYGIEASQGTLQADKVIARKNKVVRKLVAGIKAKMTQAGVTVITGEASFVAPQKEGDYTLQVGEETYTASHLIIATGSEPFVPPIPGLDQVDYWTSREALDSKELPQSIAIIGGGVIGMEFAAYYQRAGVEVHVVEMLPEILGNMDGAIAAQLRNEYSKLGIKYYLQHKVVAASPEGLTIETPTGETIQLATERLLVSVGRRVSLEPFAPLQLTTTPKGIAVNSRMQTSLSGVYAIGDVTGFSLLAHTAVREAEVAIDNLLGKDTEMSYKAIPSVVYTQPEVAGVGLTEEELQRQGIAYHKHQLPMSYAGRFVAENELANGVCKILIDSQDNILGAHILGTPASELIVIISMAIECNIKAHTLASLVFPHPTVGEIIKETIESAPLTE